MGKANWPSRWLFTDERMGDRLWSALERLPEGEGIVFRHHDAPDRRSLAGRVAELARRHRWTLAVSRDVALARAVEADLVHNPSGPSEPLPLSMAVHSLADARIANDRGAVLAFVSPLFATRSHPAASSLSRDEAAAIVSNLWCPAIALGGVDAHNYASLDGLGFKGWAGIDAWLRT